jgi:hypothetical protein
VADKFGWTAVFMVFWGFCLMTFIVWGGYTVFKFAVTKTGYTVFKFAVTKTETEDI